MMKVRSTLAVIIAGAATLAVPAMASAKTAPPKLVPYEFTGAVVSDPGANATTVTVQVKGGNIRGLRAVVGVPQPLTFRLSAGTRIYAYNGHVPSLTTSANIHATDPVRIVIRARRGLHWARLATRSAATLTDNANWGKVHGLLFLFVGKVLHVDSVHHKLTINVVDGTRRALRRLLGRTTVQTFSYDSTTTFLNWTRGIPTVFSPGSLDFGDRVGIRIRAPQ
jgi:hypothetical protein